MIVPAVRPLAKYTLELCVSTPPPVAAAAMKECVLDEYATKHRISIDRFLQLRIFVKVHDRFGLFCAWGQPQDGDLHLWLPHQCRCHLANCKAESPDLKAEWAWIVETGKSTTR
ncbi:Os06g0100400 [Oryza sativa Japonica Group]|uniref:Os06g0100400 protein n=1 Tax=Oryza sativa subsp. japonica TaxID=39947 RepID=A0A0P0WR59_ORYSJ|nr:Os06g0100400 [Oryza sativa Japonica Group]